MITDKETNFLYLADILPKKYQNFFEKFEKVLNSCDIPFGLIPNTKDIWAVDYMPIQIETGKFIQFVYSPDYLRKTKKWSQTISDVDTICKNIHIKPLKSDVVIDGGNVIKNRNKVILTDKIFKENPRYSERELIQKLENYFEVDKVIFIPTDPNDFTGHADGMVRFYDDKTVLINKYSDISLMLRIKLITALHNAGIDYIEVPYNPYSNAKNEHANGIYLNFLEMQQAIVIPTFGMKEDEMAVAKFEEIFKGQTIATVDGNSIATNGGVLNCITWNISREHSE